MLATASTLSISKQDRATVLGLRSDFECLRAQDVTNHDEVFEAIGSAAPPLAVIDLSRTKSVTTSFLMFLVHVWQRLSPRDQARFAVSGLSPDSAQIISITHLDQEWEIFESVDEAVQALSVDTH